MAGVDGLSARGHNNVITIMSKISAMMAEKSSLPSSTIDLSAAENFLIRPELIAIYKAAIEEKPTSRVL